MRFVLPSSAIDNAVTTVDAIDRLLHRVTEEVHVLILPDPDLIEETDWFRHLRPHRKEFLRQIVLAGAYRTVPPFGPHRITRTIGTDLDPIRAAALAHAPLIVLVENERTDGVLVDAAMWIYGNSEARRLWSSKFETGAAVEMRSRGGQGELGHLIEEICVRAVSAKLPVRLLVMTESDGKFRGDESVRSTSLRALCAKYGIPIKVLSCKTIENYIPDRALELWSSTPDRIAARSAVAALGRLDADARDRFPMKGKHGAQAPRPTRGMAAIDRNPDTPGEQKALFAAVSVSDRIALQDGFPDAIINVIKIHLSQLTVADFDSRDLRGDLRDLSTTIADLL